MSVLPLAVRRPRRLPGWGAVWCVVSCVACATGGGSSSGTSSSSAPFASPERDDAAAAPPPAARYDTAPRPGGVVGGPQAVQIADAVAETLRQRGDRAEPDGALAASGRQLAREVHEGAKVGMATIDAVARRAGFAGVVLWAQVYTIDGEDSGAWRDGFGQIAHNLPITRYGVSLSFDGRVVAVVFGSMEVTLDPFPRQLSPGATLKLTGQAADRFEFTSVYLTGVDGQVLETRMPGRKIAASLKLSRAGVYKVEIMGDGSSGPVVLANLPVYVGVPEPAELVPARGGTDGAPAPGAGSPAASGAGEWRARILELLNRAREKEGLNPLQPDDELAAVALGHCQDMAANGFFGHRSPTTGGPEDRLRRAGTAVTMVGENVVQADTPETAHEQLMDSPAHRGNMLGAKFTHVGVGVTPIGQNGLFVATLLFGRRPPIPAARLTAEAVKNAIAALRKEKGAPPLGIAPAFQAAAEAGVKAYANPPAGSAASQQAFRASQQTLQSELGRRGGGGASACAKLIEILDLEELAQYPELTRPALRNIGVAVALRNDTQPQRLVVLLMLDGAACP